MRDKYLCVDTETTGLEPSRYQILEFCFYVVDVAKLKVLDKLKANVKHNPYIIDPAALQVNGIDIRKHDGLGVLEASRLIDHFLCKHATIDNLDAGMEIQQLTILGHNPGFDIGFLRAAFPAVGWSEYVSHRMVDTASIALYFQDIGLLPKDLSCSLRSLTKHFGIPHDPHAAEPDVQAVIEVLKKLREAFPAAPDVASTPSGSVSVSALEAISTTCWYASSPPPMEKL